VGQAGEDRRPALFLVSAGGFDGIGRVGGGPSDVGGRALSGRDSLVQKAKIDCELGAVMRGVQNTTPENPNALATDVEERHDFEPPGFGLQGEEIEPIAGQFDETRLGVGEIEDGREHFGRRRFGRAEELSEEAAFGEKLVGQNLADSRRPGMGAEIKVRVGKFAPRGDHFI